MQGDIGLEFAMEHRPDVLILDSDLPDLSPNEFLSRLRTLSPAHTPRVVIVGTESSAAELRSVSVDLQTHILFKPYEPDELLALLQEKPYTQR
jgi:DNA-binding response OmpR family regulator